MKRTLIVLTLSLSLLATPALAVSEDTGFTDVAPDAWYAPYVMVCAQDALMNGTGGGAFSPDRVMSMSEAITLAARIHDLQQGGSGVLPAPPDDWGRITLNLPDSTQLDGYVGQLFTIELQATGGSCLTLSLSPDQMDWAQTLNGQAVSVTFSDGFTHTGTLQCPAGAATLSFVPDSGDSGNTYISALDQVQRAPAPGVWYRSTAWYLCQHDLWPDLGALLTDQPATRLDFARALAAVITDLEPINQAQPCPDLDGDAWALVAPFYQAGIFTGVDQHGTFRPNGTLTRAEAATLMARILRPELRVTQAASHPIPQVLEELGLNVVPLLPADAVTLVDGDTALIYTGDGQVLDWTGALVCDLSAYGQADPFLADGTARVKKDGLYGYMNLKGEAIVPCRYEQATQYHDGVLLAGNEAEGFTAFDARGNVLGHLDGSVNYNSTASGLIQYTDAATGLYGYVKPDGTVAVPAAYTAVYPFSNGYAAVRDSSGLAGFVNTAGELVIPCRFAFVTDGFSDEGYAVVGTAGDSASPLHYNGKLGIIDTRGALVVSQEYDVLDNFSGGLAPFIRMDDSGSPIAGYLTPDGAEHHPAQLAGDFSLPFSFTGGTAVFTENGLCGLMDTGFETVLPAAFDFCLPAASGRQAVVEVDGMLFRVDLPPAA